MKKELLSLILAVLVIFTSACSVNENGQSKDVIRPILKDETPELTIMMGAFEDIKYKYKNNDSILTRYASKFEKDMGVKVHIESLSKGVMGKSYVENDPEAIKKMAVKLSVKGGPELIFSDFTFFRAAIQQGAILDVKGKIPNISKIYDGFVDDKLYYVPIGVRYPSGGLKIQMLEDLKQQAPDHKLTDAEYEELLDQWVTKINIYFNKYEYWRLYHLYISNQIGDIENKNIKINTPEVLEGIKKLRKEIFSGKYKHIDGYTYQSYYNSMYEETSDEYKEIRQLEQQEKANSLGVDYYNLLRAGMTAKQSKQYEAIPMPDLVGEMPSLDTMGFMVNKNGKNLELAYEFINGFLSDEEQMEIFMDEPNGFLPVDKDIEALILKIEEDLVTDSRALELKKYALSRLKEGNFTTEFDKDDKLNRMFRDVTKDISKFILTDNSYTDEQLRVELRKLEDKYNIWLNE